MNKLLATVTALFLVGSTAIAGEVTAGLCRPTAKFEEMYGDLSKLELWPIAGAKLHHWEKRFTIRAPIERVFDAYLSVHPAITWPSEFVDFQFAFKPGSNQKILANDPWPRAELGTKMFVNLKAHPGKSCKMMVAVLVSSIEAPRRLRYDYLQGSSNSGVNQIELDPGVDEQGNPVTLVRHVTDYGNPSLVLSVAMLFMYEKNHGGVIAGIHNGVAAVVEGSAARP